MSSCFPSTKIIALKTSRTTLVLCFSFMLLLVLIKVIKESSFLKLSPINLSSTTPKIFPPWHMSFYQFPFFALDDFPISFVTVVAPCLCWKPKTFLWKEFPVGHFSIFLFHVCINLRDKKILKAYKYVYILKFCESNLHACVAYYIICIWTKTITT